LFKPEFLAAERINNIIETSDIFSRQSANEMLEIINDVDKVNHYNGTGWMDYKMHLNHFLKTNGIKVNWTKSGMFLK